MDEELRKLQLTQLEMLKLFDRICRENNLKYSLYAGTLLGAVRHNGFIPWDDDLDVCMPRDDYNRFISLWSQVDHDGYIMQNKENTPAFTQSFTKIRKDHTAFVQADWEVGRYHTGIFIDIFPVDRIPDGKLAQYVFLWRCMRYQLYTREFIPPLAGIIVSLGSRVLLGMTTKEERQFSREKLLKKLTARNRNKSCGVVMIETVRTMKQILAPDLLEEYVELQFEGESFMCFAKWKEYLTAKFGDYLQYPPKEQQTWAHHPICLDFENNYDEIER